MWIINDHWFLYWRSHLGSSLIFSTKIQWCASASIQKMTDTLTGTFIYIVCHFLIKYRFSTEKDQSEYYCRIFKYWLIIGFQLRILSKMSCNTRFEFAYYWFPTSNWYLYFRFIWRGLFTEGLFTEGPFYWGPFYRGAFLLRGLFTEGPFYRYTSFLHDMGEKST